MKVKLQSLLQQPGYRYVIIGGSVYVLELVIIVLAQDLGASAIEAVGLSFWVGLVASFILQKVFTFNDRRVERRVLLSQLIAFSVLVLFNFGFTLLVTRVFSRSLPAVVTRTIALGITTIWNFYIYKSRIFKRHDSILVD